MMILITSTMLCTSPLSLHDIFHKLSTGKFGRVDIDYNSLCTKIPLPKFTRAQRKKLDLIEATPRIIYTSHYDYHNHPVARWSEAEQKKLLYFVRNAARSNAYRDLILAMAIPFMLGVAPFLLIIINTIMHHQEHLSEELTQAKARYQYLIAKEQEHLVQERRTEAYRVQEAYRIAGRARTLSTVEI